MSTESLEQANAQAIHPTPTTISKFSFSSPSLLFLFTHSISHSRFSPVPFQRSFSVCEIPYFDSPEGLFECFQKPTPAICFLTPPPLDFFYRNPDSPIRKPPKDPYSSPFDFLSKPGPSFPPSTSEKNGKFYE